LCLETGKVFTWGRANYGQLGRHAVVPDGPETRTASEQRLDLLCNVPTPVPCLNGASQVKRKITILFLDFIFGGALKSLEQFPNRTSSNTAAPVFTALPVSSEVNTIQLFQIS